MCHCGLQQSPLSQLSCSRDTAWVATTSSVQHLAAVPVEVLVAAWPGISRPCIGRKRGGYEALALMAPDDFDELGIDPSAQVRVHGKLAELRDTTAQAGAAGTKLHRRALRRLLYSTVSRSTPRAFDAHAEILAIFAASRWWSTLLKGSLKRSFHFHMCHNFAECGSAGRACSAMQAFLRARGSVGASRNAFNNASIPSLRLLGDSRLQMMVRRELLEG